MSDFQAPVAQDVQSPNTVSTLQGLMSLQQTQQNIQAQKLSMQGQASTNRTLAAGADQAERVNAEQQRVTQMMKSGKDDQGNSIIGDNGEPDPAKILPAIGRIAPLTGQDFAQKILKTQNDKIGLQASSASLDAQQRAMLMGPVQAGAASGASSADIGAGIDNIVQAHNNPQMTNAATYLKGLLPHLDNLKGPQRLAAGQALAAAMQGGQAVNTQAQPGAVNNGATQSQGTFAPAIGGGGFTPSTQVTNQTGPAIVSTPAGVVRVGAGGGSASIVPSTGPTSGGLPANPSGPQATAAGGMATNDTARYSQISQEGTNATTGAQLADQVAKLADEVRTGKLTKDWADQLTILQQHDPSITARQMLTKYAAQLKTMATAGATTDASRSQIDQGMPSPETMDPDATKQAARYVGGIFRMRGARQSAADQYVKNTGSPMGIQGADDAFNRAADPTIFAYKALPAGPERQAFLKEHGLTTPDKLQDFKSRLNQVTHFSGGQ